MDYIITVIFIFSLQSNACVFGAVHVSPCVIRHACLCVRVTVGLGGLYSVKFMAWDNSTPESVSWQQDQPGVPGKRAYQE
jgi:esterase/lipase superfamily enzyme